MGHTPSSHKSLIVRFNKLVEGSPGQVWQKFQSNGREVSEEEPVGLIPTVRWQWMFNSGVSLCGFTRETSFLVPA